MKKNQITLLIHGFGSRVHDLSPLKPHLERAGFQAKLLTVEGHRSTREKLRETGRHDWFRSIRRQILPFQGRPIHLIGFSMGGLLAARFACKYQDKMDIRSVTFMGTPIRLFSMRNWIFHTWQTVQGFNTWEDGMGHLLQKVDLLNHIPSESVIELGLLMYEGKEYFSQIHLPACILHGEKDHLVHPASAEWIFRHLQTPENMKEIYFIPRAGHQLCESGFIKQTSQHILHFIQSV